VTHDEELVPTPSQTVGPYFKIGLEWLERRDLDGPDAAAPRFTVSGRVVDGAGEPVEDAVLELWRAGPDGRYPAAGPSVPAGIGRVSTDARGAFSFTTVKPGRVPGPEGTLQAPHLAVNVFMRGLLRHLVTRIYFSDEAEANAADPVLSLVEPARRATLMARADPAAPGALALTWDLVLQGPRETVFFDC
jgi:protocatechuate 3,4-dioxygenase alpha subunit